MKPKHSTAQDTGKYFPAFRRIIKYLSVLSIPLGIISCTPTYYTPNGNNVPLLTEKEEFRFSASYDSRDFTRGGEFQAALAVSDHVGIMLNGMLARSEFESTFGEDDQEYYCNGGFIEAGAGYFTVLQSYQQSSLVFESYGGIGTGRFRNNFDPEEWASEARYQRVFVQPSLGFKIKYFEIALSAKLAGLNYSRYISDVIDPSLEKFTFLIEPALVLRAGTQNVKIHLQYLTSFNINNQDLMQDFKCISIGLTFIIPGMGTDQNSTR